LSNTEHYDYTELSLAMLHNEWMPLAYVQKTAEQFSEHPDYYKSGKFMEESFNRFPRLVSELKFNEFYSALYCLQKYSAISIADFGKLHELMLQVKSVIDGIPRSAEELVGAAPPENATVG
jgi:hypothetical protein